MALRLSTAQKNVTFGHTKPKKPLIFKPKPIPIPKALVKEDSKSASPADLDIRVSEQNPEEKKALNPTKPVKSKKITLYSKIDDKKSILDKILVKTSIDKNTTQEKETFKFEENKDPEAKPETKSVSQMLTDPKTKDFAIKIKKHIYSSIEQKLNQASKVLLSKYYKMLKPGPEATFYIEVNRAGKIIELEQREQSNFPDLDYVLEQGILNAEPFPPVPESIHIEKYCISNTN